MVKSPLAGTYYAVIFTNHDFGGRASQSSVPFEVVESQVSKRARAGAPGFFPDRRFSATLTRLSSLTDGILTRVDHPPSPNLFPLKY